MRSRRTHALGEIAHIRGLERRAGEMRLGQAGVLLDERLKLEGEEHERQAARERQWAEGLTERFDPLLAQAFAAEVKSGALQVAGARSAVASAERQKGRAVETLQAAQARAEAASELERRARRQDRRAKENRLWLDVADGFIWRARHED